MIIIKAPMFGPRHPMRTLTLGLWSPSRYTRTYLEAETLSPGTLPLNLVTRSPKPQILIGPS